MSYTLALLVDGKRLNLDLREGVQDFAKMQSLASECLTFLTWIGVREPRVCVFAEDGRNVFGLPPNFEKSTPMRPEDHREG